MFNIKKWSWLGFFASSQLDFLTGLPGCCWLGNELQNEGDLEKRNYNCNANILKFSKMGFVATQLYHLSGASFMSQVPRTFSNCIYDMVSSLFHSREHTFVLLSLSCTNLTWLATFCCTNKKGKCPSRLVKLPDIIYFRIMQKKLRYNILKLCKKWDINILNSIRHTGSLHCKECCNLPWCSKNNGEQSSESCIATRDDVGILQTLEA